MSREATIQSSHCSPREPDSGPATFEEIVAALKGMTGSRIEVTTSTSAQGGSPFHGVTQFAGILGRPELPEDGEVEQEVLRFRVLGPGQASFQICREAFDNDVVSPAVVGAWFNGVHLRVGPDLEALEDRQ